MYNLGVTYSFNTRSPVFLGARIERAKLKSIVDADIARKFAPIDQMHAQVYPSLPSGTPNNPEATEYLIFEALNKSTIVFAKSWIEESSLQAVEYVSIHVTIPRANITDIELVRRVLSAANIKDFVITSE